MKAATKPLALIKTRFISRRIVFWSIVLSCLPAAGWSQSGKFSREYDEKNIQIALFRYMLKTLNEQPPIGTPHLSKPGDSESPDEIPPLERFTVYYLALHHHKDPGDNILKHFARNKPPVKKVSESYIDQRAPHFTWSSVRDKQTHEVGRIYSVGEVKWVNRTEVEVQGGFYAGGLNGMSCVYTLKRKGRAWRVTGNKDVLKA